MCTDSPLSAWWLRFSREEVHSDAHTPLAAVARLTPPRGGQVIFIIGGCTWSEVQAAHELSSGVEIVLGSTHLIESGDHFLADLASLSQQTSARPSRGNGDVQLDT